MCICMALKLLFQSFWCSSWGFSCSFFFRVADSFLTSSFLQCWQCTIYIIMVKRESLLCTHAGPDHVLPDCLSLASSWWLSLLWLMAFWCFFLQISGWQAGMFAGTVWLHRHSKWHAWCWYVQHNAQICFQNVCCLGFLKHKAHDDDTVTACRFCHKLW